MAQIQIIIVLIMYILLRILSYKIIYQLVYFTKFDFLKTLKR